MKRGQPARGLVAERGHSWMGKRLSTSRLSVALALRNVGKCAVARSFPGDNRPLARGAPAVVPYDARLANHSMARDEIRDGISRNGAAHCADCARLADRLRDSAVSGQATGRDA